MENQREQQMKQELIEAAMELVQAPALDRLINFELQSWPESERATPEELARRSKDFPEGIFVLKRKEDGFDVAQLTLSPKDVTAMQQPSTFESMRDLPIDRTSPTLWCTNIAVRQEPSSQGKGYGTLVLTKAIEWAKHQGYKRILAGVTCDGLRGRINSGQVASVEEYLERDLNPALRAFRTAAARAHVGFESFEPIADYWPVDEGSLGYGILVAVQLSEESTVEFEPSNPAFSSEYRINVDRTSLLATESRRNSEGRFEVTGTVLVPTPGCKEACDFCGVKDILSKNFPISSESALRVLGEIDEILQTTQVSGRPIETLKLFNAGNITRGTEEGKRAEMHESFWEGLPALLAEYLEVRTIELEVRVEEFADLVGGSGQLIRDRQKQIVRARLETLKTVLQQQGQALRIILPFEYLESTVLASQTKFPTAFVSSQELATRYSLNAVEWLADRGIEWHGYAMLGGRLDDRTLSTEEAIQSAAHSTAWILDKKPRSVIINSQYLTPRQQMQERQSGVKYYVPDEQAMLKTLALIVPQLRPQLSEDGNAVTCPRVWLTTDAETIVKGTVGPQIRPEFRELIAAFNNAEHQAEFFERNLRPLLKG